MTIIAHIAAKLRRVVRKTEIDRAIAELQAYSDRELADIGLTRGEIRHAVVHGRPGVEVAAAPFGRPVNDDLRQDAGRHKAA